jgi:hypothetical protein
MKNMSLKTLVMITACSIAVSELKAVDLQEQILRKDNAKNLTAFKNEKGELVVALKASRSDDEELTGVGLAVSLVTGGLTGFIGGVAIKEVNNAVGGPAAGAVGAALTAGTAIAAHAYLAPNREDAVRQAVGKKYVGISSLSAAASCLLTFLKWTPTGGNGGNGGAAGGHARH